MTEFMKAVQIHKYGAPSVLKYEEVSRPKPKENELLVRVYAAGVNPADWQICSGKRTKLKEPFSFIPGFDVSGVVEDAGKNIDGFAPGEAVYAMLRNGGGYAEYVAIPATDAARKPASLDHFQAAAMPVVSLTAWQALFDTAELSAGQKVLIHAAAGGVGHIAVQLAKWKGAYVIGTASSRNEEFLHSIGVDKFINYRKNRFEYVVQDVDVVLDAVIRDAKPLLNYAAKQTLKRSWQTLKKTGILVSICVTPSSGVASAYGVRGKYVRAQPNASQLGEIAKLTDDGHITPFISKVLPFKEVQKAHKLSRKGHIRGKIVLQVI